MKNNGESKNNDTSKWTIKETPQVTGFLQTMAVIIWLGQSGIVVFMSIYALFFASSWVRMVILGCMLVSLILPPDFPSIGHQLGDWITLKAAEYFGLKTIVEDEEALLRHSKKAALIYAFSPHDVLPFSVFAFNPILERVPGGAGIVCLVTSAVFNIPFMKHIYTWVKAKPVDRKTFLGRLHQKESFAFCPGGVQEVILLDPKQPNDIVLFLQNRKGFIKLSLATGSPIVPTFGFHLDGAFGYWAPRGAFIEKLSRTIGFLPMIYWGRCFIPYGIPHAKKLTIVIGSPIDVPKMDEVTSADVEKYHQLFVDEVIQLFERHKHGEGYGDKQLRIA